MPVIAITGGVGAGKSAVASDFRDIGATVFSADEAAREVLEPGSATLDAVFREFGPNYFLADGRLDRRRMAELVFSDSDARKRLESIMHPPIRRLLTERTNEVLSKNPKAFVFVEVPLLYETGAKSGYDAVIAVIAFRKNQVRRLRERDGLDEKEVNKRIATQLPMEEKALRADYVIDNNGNRDALKRAVRSVWDQIVGSGTKSIAEKR
jgi:dephospho-CoA kinase